MRAEDFYGCCDWLSYGQINVSFTADIQYEYLKQQIGINVQRAMSLAHAEYQADPVKLSKFLMDVRFQFPRIAAVPMFRHLVMGTTIQARLVQEEDRRINLERMAAQRIDKAQRRALPPVMPQQGRL